MSTDTQQTPPEPHNAVTDQDQSSIQATQSQEGQGNGSGLIPVPGLEVVGCGIRLTPYKPFELRASLFKRNAVTPWYCGDTGATYAVPEGYGVNTSPPMPHGYALNQTVIEESFERFESQFKLDATAAVSGASFSVDASGSQMSQTRVEEEAYYAVRTSFVPLWAVYIPDTTTVSEDAFDLDIPTPFDRAHRADYESFFQQYGTHYVKRAWVGGKAILAFSIDKSSEMTKRQIQSGLQVNLPAGSAGINSSTSENREKLRSNSDCTVTGKGGDELRLAALSSLDENAYNAWLTTVKENPQTIELEVAGLWTLVRDPDKALALMTAYREETVFPPVTAVFGIGSNIYFLRGEYVVIYDRNKHETLPPRLLTEVWEDLARTKITRFDAALRGKYLTSPEGEDLSRKLYLFKRNRYVRLDLESGLIDEGCPEPKYIKDGWPGVPFERIDAAFNEGPEHTYFFMGNQYVRYRTPEHQVDPDYPQRIGQRWQGLPFDRIDAAHYLGNGKALFFRGDQHLQYDLTVFRADPGYPKAVIGSYVEDCRFFD